MKDKGFYRKVYLCKIILMFMPGFTSTREKGVPFLKGKLIPCWCDKGSPRALFLHLSILGCC